MRSAACVIGGIPRAGHVSGYMLDVLHWLPLGMDHIADCCICLAVFTGLAAAYSWFILMHSTLALKLFY